MEGSLRQRGRCPAVQQVKDAGDEHKEVGSWRPCEGAQEGASAPAPKALHGMGLGQVFSFQPLCPPWHSHDRAVPPRAALPVWLWTPLRRPRALSAGPLQAMVFCILIPGWAARDANPWAPAEPTGPPRRRAPRLPAPTHLRCSSPYTQPGISTITNLNS